MEAKDRSDICIDPNAPKTAQVKPEGDGFMVTFFDHRLSGGALSPLLNALWTADEMKEISAAFAAAVRTGEETTTPARTE